jgi:hypothetical protein
MAAMKPQTRAVLDYLRQNADKDLTAADVAEALGLDTRQVNGSFTSFQKKEWGFREEVEIEMPDGSHRKAKLLHLNDLGMTVDPDSAE